MRKFIIALALALAATVGLSVPANAASTGGACVETGRGIVTCMTITWTTSNMAITSVKLTTPQNCGNVQNYPYWTADSPNKNYGFGAVNSCSKTVAIYETNRADAVAFWVDTKVRVAAGEDWTIHWEFWLNRSGASNWTMWPRPVGDCC